MNERRFLVTGAMGCIGAWTLYNLVQAGEKAVSFDLSEDRHRLDLLLTPEEQAQITFVRGDITDTEQVQRVFADNGITHVIHLAALQVPFCKANPVLGSRVNVVGTINIFEAAKKTGIRHIAYASSIAVYGPPEDYPAGPIAHEAPFAPRTLYGVYKQANESSAQVYWQDDGISSVTVRAYTVYGVARDQGLTSEPTKAMLAAAAGQPYHIAFGGMMQWQYASDVARQFIEGALMVRDGAYGFNLGGDAVTVEEVAHVIQQIRPESQITVGDKRLPFPERFDDTALHAHFDRVYHTPLVDGVRETIKRFEAALADGRIRYEA